MTPALIYATSLENYLKKYKETYKVAGGDGYRSIAFTDDGYLITHGKIFKQAVTDESGAVSNSITVGADGKLNVTIGGQNASSGILLTSGTSIGITYTNNTYTISHTTAQSSDDDLSFTSTISNYILKLGTLKYSKDYGHVTGTSVDTSGVHLDYVGQLLATASSNNTYYLLGSTSDVETTGATVKNTDAKIVIGTNGPILYTRGLNVSGGESEITLGTGSTTLKSYIESEVEKAKTAAVIYQGTLTPEETKANAKLPADTPVTGDMYKISATGYIKLTDTDSGTAVKIGDAVIYRGIIEGVTTWDLIPAGDEDETYIQYNGGTAASGTFNFTGNAISYDSTNKKFTITNTTYSNFTGASNTSAGSSGLVIAPTAGQQGYFLKGNGSWSEISSSDISGLGNAKHIIAIGAAGTENTNWQKAGEEFTANATSAATTYIPLANQNTKITWGAVKGNSNSTVPTSSDWTEAQIIDGVVKFYDHVYSFSNLIVKGTLADSTSAQMSYDSQADRTIEFGANLTATYDSSKHIFTIAGTADTWRQIYAYQISTTTKDNDTTATTAVLSSTNTKALQFGPEFVWTEADTNGESGTAEIHLVWAEVADGGAVSYHV